MKTLSIRQPWAFLIIHGGKDIENRNWASGFRGRFLVHAAKGCTRDEYEDACSTVEHINRIRGTDIQVPALKDLQRGGIIGSVEMIGCVDSSASPWFFGNYGFVLRDPVPMEFIPYKGQLQFFSVPDELLEVISV
jgi:hypothetical protein